MSWSRRRLQARGFRFAFLLAQFQGRGQGHDKGHILRSGALAVLVPAADEVGQIGRSTAQI